MSPRIAISAIGLTGVLAASFGIAAEDAPSAPESQETSPRCKVTRSALVEGGVAPATMTVRNDGKPCRLRYHFPGQMPPDTWQLVEPPKSGRVTFEGDEARYTPNAGFTGEDEFIVAVFGRLRTSRSTGRNGQFKVEVTVQPGT